MDLSKYNDILQYVKNLFENDLQVLEAKQVILYGSATYPGCFDEITSDIDIIALVGKTDTRSLDDIVSLLANKMQNNMGYKRPLIIRDGAGERVEFSVVFRHTVIDCTIMKSLLPDYVEWQYSAVHDSVDVIIGSIVNKGFALIGDKANLVDSNLDIQPFYDDGLRAKRLKTLSTYLYKKVIRIRQLIKADNPEVIDYYFRYRTVFLKWLFCYLREYPVNFFKHLHFQLESMKDKMGESRLSQQEQSVIMLQSSDSIQESISNFLDLYEGFLYQYQHEDANEE